MELVGIGIIVIFLLAFVARWWIKRKPHEENEDADSHIYVPPVGPPPSIIPNSPNSSNSDRWFTLVELKQAEEGKYNWDETGCVFEINSDGSVTVVGHFDPEELRIDPAQEMIERLNNDGLNEMLPRMCCFHTVNDKCGEDDAFVLVWNNDILSVPSCPHTIEEVKAVSLIISSLEGGKSVITDILSKTANGYLTLLPSNEKEYILSLGAKACVERALGDKVRIKISSPAVMGAFGIAIAKATDQQLKISFAFGVDEDYMCCNLLAKDGIYEVKKLLFSSIIQPTEPFTTLHHIAKGCMVQSLIREGRVTNYRLIDMLPYTASLLLKENGRVIKIYDCISEPTSIPTRQGDKDINVDANNVLSFLIGSNELIEDVITECDSPKGIVGAFIELDSNMDMIIKIASTTNEYKIKVGELIG
ncbi:MAG: hypothetical protein HDS77_09050 [Bacteroidales bacterium]|nr:hypothetical protein [Bacteroidales bacterium]